jgi:hypothetical protein
MENKTKEAVDDQKATEQAIKEGEKQQKDRIPEPVETVNATEVHGAQTKHTKIDGKDVGSKDPANQTPQHPSKSGSLTSHDLNQGGKKTSAA